MMAAMLREGAINLQNPAQTAERFRQHAEKGSLPAQYALGVVLVRMGGDSAQRSEGLRWIRAAADGGDDQARSHLGELMLVGPPELRDPAKGRELLEKAAANGSTRAMHSLGLAYLNGSGVDADAAIAATWFSTTWVCSTPKTKTSPRIPKPPSAGS
jgi:hypothetical protein